MGNMLRTLATSAFAATVLLASSPVSAQCGGQGNLAIEIVSVTNSGTVPGADVVLRVVGRPFALVCFACDTGRGATVIPGIGTSCLPFTTNFVEIAFFLPASGVLEAQVRLPSDPSSTVICCQAFGFDPAAPNNVALSNTFCFAVEPPCVSGGFAEIGYITKVANVTAFPVQVSSSVVGSSGGSGSPVTSVLYDPAAQLAFPIHDNDSVYIENIVRVGDDLYVTTLVRAAAPLSHQSHPGRLPNNLALSVTAGSTTNAFSPVHVSCSQPFAVGMVFGPFTITSATPFH